MIPRAIDKYIHIGLDFLFPRRCISCHTSGVTLCMNCIGSLPNASRDTEISDTIYALFEYQNDVVKRAIWRLKYKGDKDIARVFGTILYDHLISLLEDDFVFNPHEKPLLVPIPLSKKRLRKRGFNQSEALIREIKLCDTQDFFDTAPRILKKIRHTAPQTSLRSRRERLKNISGCFAITDMEFIRGKNIVIIDDVYTTGGTLKDAVRAMKRAGAKKIYAIVIAH